MEIFRLFGSIFVDNSEANEAMDTTEKKGEGLGSKLVNVFGGIGKAAAGFATAVVGASTAFVGGVSAMVSQSAAYADEIDKLSERTGINREELQRWKYAADQSGADIHKLETGIKTLSTQMESATGGAQSNIEAFEALGITVNDLGEKTQEEIFERVIMGLAEMEEGAERNVLGNSLLGKSYTELLPLINAGADGIDELKDRADDLGLVMGEDAVKAGVVFGDTLADVKNTIGAIGRQIGTAAMPILQEFLEKILEYVPVFLNLSNTLIPSIQSAFETLAPVIFMLIENVFPLLMNAFETLLPLLSEMGGGVIPILVEGLIGLAVPFSNLIESLLPVLIELFSVLTSNIFPLIINLVTSLASSVLPPLINGFSKLIISVLPPLTTLLETITGSVLPVLIELFVSVIETILPPLIDLFVEIASAVLPVVIEVLTLLIEIFSGVIEAIRPLIDMILPFLLEKFTTVFQGIQIVVETVTGILTNNIETVKTIFTGLIDFVTGVFTGDWKKAWNAVSDIFGAIFQGMKTLFTEPINFIIDGINSFIRGINDIQIPDWVPGVGGLGFSIKEIPRLYSGMDYVPYDYFPAFLDEGERVLTKEENKAYTNNKNQSNTTYNMYFNNVKENDTAFKVKREMKRINRIELGVI